MTFGALAYGILQQKRKSVLAYTQFCVSVRKIRNGYFGYCMQVRRSSDNATQDVGFIGKDLDTESLLDFVGAGSGYVTIWYDQSGEENNAIQNDTTYQPKIVDSGNVLTLNGKPAINFTNAYLQFNAIDTPDYIALFTVHKVDSATSYNSYFLMGDTNRYCFLVVSDSTTNLFKSTFVKTYNSIEYNFPTDTGTKTNGRRIPTLQNLDTWLFDGSGPANYYSDLISCKQQQLTSAGWGGAKTYGRIGSLSSSGSVINITLHLQEVDLYNTNQYSTFAAIQSDILNYYQISDSIPGIVTNGLTMFIDAENPRSYPGSGSIFYDLTHELDCVINGLPTFNSSSPKSFTFDGSNDQIDINNITKLVKNNDATVDMWFKPTGTSPTITAPWVGQALIIDGQVGGSGYFHITRGVLGGNDRIHVANYPQNIQVTYNVNEWINISLVHTGGVLYAYKNGYEFNHVNSGNTGNFQNNLYIGFLNASGYKKFTGEVSTCATYDRGLSAAEILQNYNALKDRYL